MLFFFFSPPVTEHDKLERMTPAGFGTKGKNTCYDGAMIKLKMEYASCMGGYLFLIEYI